MANFFKKCFMVLFAISFMLVAGLIGLLRVLWVFVTNPFTAFKKIPREIPPACLLDPSLGSHEYINVNGMKIHCVVSGHRSKPLMLFLHGFPEFWFSWRFQIREFNKDYRVVAIDMRGYGESSRPPNKLDYTIDKLGKDIAEIIPALGYSKCTLVAHDWGGGVGWYVAMTYPELVERYIVMNSPHFKVVQKTIQKHKKQLLMSWYMFMFQWPKLPELALSINDFKAIEMSFIGHPLGAKNKAAFPPDVLEAYKYTFSQRGALTAPINYYRCLRHGPKPSKQPIELPVLVIWGDDDAFLTKEMADEHASVLSNVTIRHIPNCSHWVQQDAPEKVNEYMREFLQE